MMAVENDFLSLMKYVEGISNITQKIELNVTKQNRYFKYLEDLKNNEYIQIWNGNEETSLLGKEGLFLVVKKPAETKGCPLPTKAMKEWLADDKWENYEGSVNVLRALDGEELFNLKNEKGFTFDGNIELTKRFFDWQKARNEWVKIEEKVAIARKIFVELHSTYRELEKDEDTLELLIGCGEVSYNLENTKAREVLDYKNLKYPIITQKVRIELDTNTNSILIYDNGDGLNVESPLIQKIEDIDTEALKAGAKALEDGEYSIMEKKNISEAITKFANGLCADSKFVDELHPVIDGKERLLFEYKPILFVRKKQEGITAAVESITEAIENGSLVPNHIKELIAGGMAEVETKETEESFEEKLAAVSGESPDIYLAKEANKEQLEIAKRIEVNNAVRVQGPPGTGKTHTIANLMGHFLAQGKTVLVTSHTKKALRVLKEKLPKEIQSLCVAYFDDNKDEMKKSVEDIIEKQSESLPNLAKNCKRLELERKELLGEMASVRKKMFNIKNKESNKITFNGEGYSLSKMASFVCDNKDALESVIPDEVSESFKMKAFPLDLKNLEELYKTNDKISKEEERSFENGLITLDKLSSVEDFSKMVDDYDGKAQEKKNLETKYGLEEVCVEGNNLYCLKNSKKIRLYDKKAENHLNEVLKHFETIELRPWQKACIQDGKRGEAFKKQWFELIDSLKEYEQINEKLIVFGPKKKIEIDQTIDVNILFKELEKIKNNFKNNKSVSKFLKILHKDYFKVLETTKISGEKLTCEEDVDYIFNSLEFRKIKETVMECWENLITTNGGPKLDLTQIDITSPEVVEDIKRKIEYALDWYTDSYEKCVKIIEDNNLNKANYIICDNETILNETDRLETLLERLYKMLPSHIKIIQATLAVDRAKENYQNLNNEIRNYKEAKNTKQKTFNEIDKALFKAIDELDKTNYAMIYEKLKEIWNKNSVYLKRIELLNKVAEYFPIWAENIRSKKGEFSNNEVPKNILDAWKWKQFNCFLEEYNKEPFDQLQINARKISKELKKANEKIVVALAWKHLIEHNQGNKDIGLALNTWANLIKKIGKGTGKKAPRYRREARKVMLECQAAVPAWIIPEADVLKTFLPGENKFDIIIFDEASQSTVLALPILFMGKKMIVVGDDKQVSPSAIGGDDDKVLNLKNLYLDNIKGRGSYELDASLYSIVGGTYRTLMLKEHFRCVPEIINFSNKKFYSNEIKPLRDASHSKLKPALVTYQVDGERSNSKTNEVEADTIVAFIQACLEKREYNGKTFGVISLLGDNQAKLIDRKLGTALEASVIEERKIICGNAAQFQGDERDVIFLSMVDSGEGVPLTMRKEGKGNMNYQRYNVAVSRAKDQLILVYSLDENIELKPGDIRKELISYMKDPESYESVQAKVKAEADSPFEEEVVMRLKNKGFNITQQWPVGAYRIDLVASYKDKKIAIELDGERYHSSPEQVTNDMQRQTILERIGWTFIRVRGSEYYGGKDDAINRVVRELNDYGIETEDENHQGEEISITSDLVEGLKRRVDELLNPKLSQTRYEDADVISENFNTEINSKPLKLEVKEDVKPSEIKSMQYKIKLMNGNIVKSTSFEKKAKVEEKEAASYTAPMKKSDTIGFARNSIRNNEVRDKQLKDALNNALAQKEANKNKKIEEVKAHITKPKAKINTKHNKPTMFSKNTIDLNVDKCLGELRNQGLEVIDNRPESKMIWVYKKSFDKELVNEIFESLNIKPTFFARGSKELQGEQGWRFKIKDN